MKTGAQLPIEIKRLINGKSTRVLHVQKTDLTEERRFGRGFLILTDAELITISGEKVLSEMPLSELKQVRIDELAGCGRVTAETSEGLKHLLYYSNHLVPEFADSTRIINHFLHNNELSEGTIEHGSHCSRCSSPLPERGSRCPRCVPRLKILKRIIALSAPYKIRIFFLMLVTGAGVLFQVLPPYITKKIVDEVIGKGDIQKLYYYTGAMIGCGVLYLAMRLISINLTSWVGARIVTDLRSRLHSVLQYLKLSFFTRREPGELVGRIMHDTGELQQFLIDGLPSLVINVISFVVVGVILLKINWALTLFVLVPVPMLILGSSWFWSKLRPLFLREGTMVGHLYSVLGESLQGLRVIKACSRERHRIIIFDSVNNRLASTQVTTQRVSGSFNETMYWIMSLGVTFVWFFASKMITGGKSDFTIGDLLAFVGYIWLFYGPLQWFSVILHWMTHAFSGAERIFEVLDTSPERYESSHSVTLPEIKGSIEFRDLHFSYERGKEVIKGISFKIEPGEIIGLIGRSGAGKSTVINLLTRFFEPDSGEILIDGVPLSRIKLSQLRSNIGLVMQESFLFNASIAENIAYGMEHASFKEIIEAAKAAHAHEFIIRKRDGYDTIVGDTGERLSGGEKQRIAIARAILHNPPILVLDEATSSVDSTTERHIQEAINGLIKGRTTIAIAHRLSTLRNASRLVVLSDGKLAEIGTHDELIEKNGIYADLLRSHTEMNALQSVMWG
ncbi:MAG: ABC transporter ATP-binding protein [Fibrobacter sp.]|jgi:ATP-binding cassette subfamily B protein|nr:ABC transporter ATP-binding protein [Fibrobacter sp.]